MVGRAVALIPARAGSKRIPRKNSKPLAGHPLLAYTIAAAIESGVFGAVVVSSEDETTRRIARHYGAVACDRRAGLAGDTSPDIGWVVQTILTLRARGDLYDLFALLRPTSPFRSAATIRAAVTAFTNAGIADSLRAVRPVTEHPGKMWVQRGGRLLPLLPFTTPDGTPWHSNQKPALPEVYVQTAALEVAWTRTVTEGGTIAGEVVLPWEMPGHEGLDLNTPDDWGRAEALIASGAAALPTVRKEAWDAP